MNIYEIEEEYKYPTIDIFSDYQYDYLKVLKILNDSSIVPDYKRRLFILYLECGSLRKTQHQCGISYRKIGNVVADVKKIIIMNICL